MNDREDGSERISLVEEELSVDKRTIETGRVRLQTFVEEEQVTLHEELLREAVDVQRIPINERVEFAPSVRTEGDLLIVPIVEERLVVEKQLFVVEELRVRRSISPVRVDVPATRRVMRAEVERDEPETQNRRGKNG